LARCYQAMNEAEMAIEEFERTLSFNPGHLKAMKSLAYLQYKNKKREQGNVVLLKMALYDPLNSELIEFLKSEGLAPDTVGRQDISAAEENPAVIQDEKAMEANETEESTPVFEETEIDLEKMEDPLSGTSATAKDLLPKDDIIEDLFTEEEPAVDLDPIQDVPDTLAEQSSGLSRSDAEQDDFERNNIDARLEETATFHKPLDLDQFDNTEDDFSTLIEGYFEDQEEDVTVLEETDTDEPAETEEPVEERSLLDTTVIFREKRSEDQETPESAEEAPPIVNDFNAVANEIEQMSYEEPAIIEADMEEEMEEEDNTASLNNVIERIEQTTLSKKEIGDDFNADIAKEFEEEKVNIDDILQNPSLLTPTFGEILIAQKKFQDAREVFIALSRREPENDRFRKKIEFLGKIVAIQK